MVTAVFGVLAVMYTAVTSRRVEIGMLKAIGSPARTLRGAFIGDHHHAVGCTSRHRGRCVLGYAFELSQRFAQEQIAGVRLHDRRGDPADGAAASSVRPSPRSR